VREAEPPPPSPNIPACFALAPAMAFIYQAGCALALLAAAVAPCDATGSLVRREKLMRPNGLQAALEKALKGQAVGRLFAVEASVRPAFEAFPKSALGQIPPVEAFAGIARSYFAKEHGWVLKGLEPYARLGPAQRPSAVPGTKVLRDRAPDVAAALEAIHTSGHGLSLSDVVGTIAVVEHLVVEDAAGLLPAAYTLNNVSMEGEIEQQQLHDILESYLLLFRAGSEANPTDFEDHRKLKEAARASDDWSALQAFEGGVVLAARAKGPKYTYDDVRDIVRALALGYGRWQNDECLEMKATLMGLSAGSPGLVPFDVFHAEPAHSSFQFSESAQYLREIGALEEPEDGSAAPQVRIASYMLGPTNCIASLEYHMVCCLSECEAIVGDVEAQAQSPVTSADELARIVQATAPASGAEAPGPLTEEVVAGLQGIVDSSSGVVSLHSSDFRRWMNTAFPNECPLPTASEAAAEDAEMVEASRWLQRQQHPQQCTRLPAWHPAHEAEFEI